MLIRVGGGSEGIAEYLRDGQKQGRQFTRDELDERVILDGDLELTDTIIKGMNNQGERYLHITLAFKEDEVSPETLQSITEDFKQFVMIAYDADEFNFYAEAHLPKIKSYICKKTGDFIERKPHIHIVIPEKNLLSGQRLNPLGRVEHQTKFLEAFQEHANAKYGLASPKDNRRSEFTGESEIISRYKGDFFKGNAQALKERILSDVLDRQITDYDKFKFMLTEHGATRTRNAGTEGEYENIKPSGYDKGVNLKDYVFSREFIEKPQADKEKFITDEITNQYHSQEQARDTDQRYLALLNEWQDVRAPEIKYINSGNRKLYTAFKNADQDGKRLIIAERAAKFNHKHRPENNLTINGKDITNERPDYQRINAERAGSGHRAALVYQSDLDAARRQAPPQPLASVRNLSSSDMVHTGNEASLLLQANARDSMAQGRSTDHEMRRARAGDDRDVGGQEIEHTSNRSADGVINQFQYEHGELVRGDKAATLDEFKLIKRELDARQLLDHLSQTHGVMPEKYEVTKSSDGGDRIRAGSRNLNVSDFLTKEMNLSFAEAAPILKREYERQQADKIEIPLPAREPRRRLWDEYSEYHQAAKPTRNAAWVQQHQGEQERKKAIKAEHANRCAEIQKNYPTKTAERKVARSLAATSTDDAKAALEQVIAVERDGLRASGKVSQEGYKDFLLYKAQQGDEKALAELRRQRITRCAAQSNCFKGGDKRDIGEQEEQRAPILRRIPFAVDRQGSVTYYADHAKQHALVTDAGEHVDVADTRSNHAIKVGLRLAMQKWGAEINVTGSEEFKEQCAKVAAELGLNVKFNEKRIDELRCDRRNAIDAERQQKLREQADSKVAELEQRKSPAQEGTADIAQSAEDKDVKEVETALIQVQTDLTIELDNTTTDEVKKDDQIDDDYDYPRM